MESDRILVILDNRTGEILLMHYNDEELDEKYGGDLIAMLENSGDFEYHPDLKYMAVDKIFIKTIER